MRYVHSIICVYVTISYVPTERKGSSYTVLYERDTYNTVYYLQKKKEVNLTHIVITYI